MKHLILGFMVLLLAPVPAAQAQTDWRTLVTGSAYSGFAVKGAKKIDVGVAKTLHDRGVTFIDARGENRWKLGHIPRAISLFIVTKAELKEIVDKNKEVVFYCGGTDCSLSAYACAKAVAWGYKNVYYFAEGYPGWKAAGYPIAKPK